MATSSRETNLGDSPATFRPYRSILTPHHISTDPLSPSSPPSSSSSPSLPQTSQTTHRIPPWRRPIGRGFFLLDSQFSRVYGEDIPTNESDQYANILESTFHAFSNELVGSDITPLDLSIPSILPQGMDWEVDQIPAKYLVEGDTEILYNLFESSPSRPR